jgi:hypothetical protein
MSPGYDPENLHDDACGIDWVLRFSGIVLNPKRPGPLTDLSWDCLRRHASRVMSAAGPIADASQTRHYFR